jgi:acetyl esterase/lipase
VLNQHKLPPAPCIAYGDHPDQVANLHLPAKEGGPWPCVVLIHGGFWRTGWDRTLMTGLAVELAGRGIAAWNVEYRRVGQPGGGWPGTLEDAAAAVDRLAEVDEVDADRVVTCGHSAGGHLALWLAARHRIPAGSPGAGPRVRPVGAVAQAAVCDLERAWRDGLGSGAVAGLLGSLDDTPERYAAASPAALAPLGIPLLLVHGDADDIVPLSQSRDFAALDPAVDLVELEGADHFDVIDARHAAWETTVEWLSRRLGREGPRASP